MGWRICFFGFNRQPDIETLKGLQWLDSWRVFHEPDTGAWFLEGQCESDEITFYEEVKTTQPNASDESESLFKSIESEIAQNDGFKHLFDPYPTGIAHRLSQDLSQPVAAFLGDDEGIDSCFIFDKGRLVRGRLEVDWNKALTFDSDGHAALDWLYPEGVSDADPDFKPTRIIYQIAVEEADRFFDRHSLGETLTFDRDIKPRQYLLKAKKGAPDPPIRRPIDELTDRLGRAPTPQDLVAAFDPVVEAILAPGFPDAANAHRFEMDDRISACAVYLHRLQLGASDNATFLADMQAFLGDIGTYTKRLRPKPEFRSKSIVFDGWDRKLSGKWRRLKRRAKPRGGWLFG